MCVHIGRFARGQDDDDGVWDRQKENVASLAEKYFDCYCHTNIFEIRSLLIILQVSLPTSLSSGLLGAQCWGSFW